jgi:hypothetical protein
MTRARSARAPTRAREPPSRSHRRHAAPADSRRRPSQAPAGAESARPMTRCQPTERLSAATRRGARGGWRRCARGSWQGGAPRTRRRPAPVAPASVPSELARRGPALGSESPRNRPCRCRYWVPEPAVMGGHRDQSHRRRRRPRWSPSHPLPGRPSSAFRMTGPRRPSATLRSPPEVTMRPMRRSSTHPCTAG